MTEHSFMVGSEGKADYLLLDVHNKVALGVKPFLAFTETGGVVALRLRAAPHINAGTVLPTEAQIASAYDLPWQKQGADRASLVVGLAWEGYTVKYSDIDEGVKTLLHWMTNALNEKVGVEDDQEGWLLEKYEEIFNQAFPTGSVSFNEELLFGGKKTKAKKAFKPNTPEVTKQEGATNVINLNFPDTELPDEE